MSQPMKISLCMIVKNEEDCIMRCLNSVKNVVDEMIIVDTGSEDRTIELCEEAGAKVYSYQWNGSFADARNHGIKLAQSEWILWMDADEELAHIKREDFLKLIDLSSSKLLSVQLVNYMSEQMDDTDVYLISHPRIFRNHIGFQFEYTIHETLNAEDVLGQEDKEKFELGNPLPLIIYHYGYMSSHTDRKKKFERNLSMLLQDSAKKHPWREYHIASEYYRIHDYNKSFEYINHSIIRFLRAGMTPPSLLYKLKYSILISTGSWEGAWPGIDKAIQLYPNYVDLHFYKGIIFYLKEKYEEAIVIFEKCIKIGENNLQHLTLRGTGSFHAYYYIGQCFQKLGKCEDAIKAYTSSLQLCPSHSSSKEAIILLKKQYKE